MSDLLICTKHKTLHYRPQSGGGQRCRECGKERSASYASSAKGKATRKASMKIWHTTEKGRERRRIDSRRQAKTQHGREATRARIDRYQATEKGRAALARAYANQTSQQRAARKAVSHAIERGELVRPEDCTRCGSSRTIQAHHYLGYEVEHFLSIVWLCGPCHKRIDRLAPHATVLFRLDARKRSRVLAVFLSVPLDKRDGHRDTTVTYNVNGTIKQTS